MRSSRKNTLALPDGVEGDASTDVNGVPVNLVDFFEVAGISCKNAFHLLRAMREVIDQVDGDPIERSTARLATL
jgi:hypothetical protein